MPLPSQIQRELRGMQFKSGVCFYIGIPVLAGLLLGWNRVFVGAEVARSVAIAFWVGLALLEWFAAIIGSQVAYSLLRPWRPPAVVVWCIGVALAACAFFYPISRYLEFGSVLGGLTHLPAHLRTESIPQFLVTVAADVFPGMALWVAANYLYTEFLGIPRHEYPKTTGMQGGRAAIQSDTSSTDAVESIVNNAEPHFMRFVAADKRGVLVALEAQDHYVCVTTDRGQDLIHYRFSDAVRDVCDVQGLRVHRSYWVSAAAIAALERDKHSYQLRLANEMSVPVSRSYLRDVRSVLEERGASVEPVKTQC